MIIGNGNIARVIDDRDDVIFFASGVSDSSCTDDDAFIREIELLYGQDRNKHLVYFSGHNIYTKTTPYAKHKIGMEQTVKHLFNSYTIVRLGICDWNTNPKTIINHYKEVIKSGRPIVYNSDDMIRHIVTLNDFKYWLSLIRVGEREEMNITGRMITVPELIEEIKQGKL
jgi:UDP-2-acetamido-2,6-beta-L-arabino-hexul-4-ose reductase